MSFQFKTPLLQKQAARVLPDLQWTYADKDPTALATLTERIKEAIAARTTISYSDWTKGVPFTDASVEGSAPRNLDSRDMEEAGIEFLQYIALHSFVSKGTLDSAVVVENVQQTLQNSAPLSPHSNFYDFADTLGLSIKSRRADEQAFWELELRIVNGDCPPTERRWDNTIYKRRYSPTPIESQIQQLFKSKQEIDKLLSHLRELDYLTGTLYRNYGRATNKPDSRKLIGENSTPVQTNTISEAGVEQSKSKRLIAEQGILLGQQIFRTVSALANDGQRLTLSRVAHELEGLEAMVSATMVLVQAIEMSALIRLPPTPRKSSGTAPPIVSSSLPLNTQLRAHATALGRFVTYYSDIKTHLGIDMTNNSVVSEDRLWIFLPDEAAIIDELREGMNKLWEALAESRAALDESRTAQAKSDAELNKSRRENQALAEEVEEIRSTRFPDVPKDGYDVAFFEKQLKRSDTLIQKRMKEYAEGAEYEFEEGKGGRKFTLDRQRAMDFEAYCRSKEKGAAQQGNTWKKTL